jgi:hypothetical protein
MRHLSDAGHGYHYAGEPERISVAMMAKETAHQAADAAAGRRHRFGRACLACCVGALALGALAGASHAGARRDAPASLATVPGLSRSGPMIPAHVRGHRITKAAIGLFTATPAQVPAGGGKVRLVAQVHGATRCRFSSSQEFGALPATRSCGSGSVSVTVTLPKNHSGAARRFRFSLTAAGPHSRTSAGPVAVLENARASAGAPPAVTTQPTGRSVSPGATVSFTAAATASSAVHWQVSSDGGHSWVNVPGADSLTYSFSATLAESGREYRAVFSNSHGTTHTHAATLTVAAPPSPIGTGPALVAPALTLQPASASVTVGAAVSFSAAASGSPAPGVQWQLSTNGGGSWSAVPAATSGTYALTAQLGESGYLYRAVFANAAGTAASNPATLTVSAPVQAPVVSTQPTSQSVVTGSSATFTATASGSPPPTEQWQVSSDGGSTWAAIAGATSASYTIASATQDGLKYRAVFTNASGTVTTNVATLGVGSASAPVVTAQPVNATVTANNSVSFGAGASGTPTPSVRWQVSNNDGITWSDIPGATSTLLSFLATGPQNGDEYHAVFTNPSGTVTSNAATLTVHVAPQITTQPASASVVVGSTASFTVSASGTAPLTVQWQVSTDGGTSWSDLSSATSNTYSFTASQSQSGYEYHAIFTNPVGAVTSNAATLTVGPNAVGPVITVQPSDQAVVGNSTVQLTAGASGVPTPSVQWQVSTDNGATWSSVAGANAATYSFTAMASENGNRYEAVFTNGSGSATSAAARLAVGAYASATNWAGYTATGTNITMVSGSWIVPTATCTGSTTFSSAWIGIDGAQPGAATVEQDGTDSDCQGSNPTPTYSAWWELYPDYSTPLPSGYNVAAGDSMHGSVSLSGGVWTLSITDASVPWTYTQQVTNPSPRPAETSVEWIIERPGICGSDGQCPAASLTNFGTIGFTGASATENGVTGSLNSLNASPLQMSQGSTLFALPSLTPDGSSFSVTYYNSN